MLLEEMNRAGLRDVIAKWVDVKALLDRDAPDDELMACIARIHPWLVAAESTRKPTPKQAPKQAPKPKPLKPGPEWPAQPSRKTFVGLFVHTWHDIWPARNVIGGKTPMSAGGWWWWGRPAFGRGDMSKYTWQNVAMIDYHIDRFIELGADFIFLDFTNGTHPEILEGAHALCKRLDERRAGPRVVFWIEKMEHVGLFRDQFYNSYTKELFFHYLGKPLLLIHGISDGWTLSRTVKPLPSTPRDFTVRWMWGLIGDAAGTMWSFKELQPPRPYIHQGAAEHIGMAFATQQFYMTDPQTRRCRDGGRFFQSQVANVRKHRPRFVTITAYNEWMAINLGTAAKPVFTDLLDPECSADIEPMHGGHGAKYFVMAKDFIRSLR
jgi:hypothetical protein